MPHISVICPTYNSAAYIERTVQSILQQTVSPAQVIFSDDGSRDDTVGVLQRQRAAFERAGIAWILLQHAHIGPGGNRNRGIQQASGEWVAFLDADDLWAPGKLAAVAETIRQQSEVNFVVHWEEFVQLSGARQVLRHGSAYRGLPDLGRAVYRHNAFSTSAVVCRRSLLERCAGFDATLPVSQDYELWLRLAPQIRLAVIESVLGTYVERPGNITSRPYALRYACLMRILLRHWRKGGLALMGYRALRATCSPEWLRSLLRNRREAHCA